MQTLDTYMTKAKTPNAQHQQENLGPGSSSLLFSLLSSRLSHFLSLSSHLLSTSLLSSCPSLPPLSPFSSLLSLPYSLLSLFSTLSLSLLLSLSCPSPLVSPLVSPLISLFSSVSDFFFFFSLLHPLPRERAGAMPQAGQVFKRAPDQAPTTEHSQVSLLSPYEDQTQVQNDDGSAFRDQDRPHPCDSWRFCHARTRRTSKSADSSAFRDQDPPPLIAVTVHNFETRRPTACPKKLQLPGPS